MSMFYDPLAEQDEQEFYGYDGGPGVFGVGPDLETLMAVQGLFDTQLNRGPVSPSGSYQDPFTPHYQTIRHLANILGKDWMTVLGLTPQEPLPPEPQRAENPYAQFLGLMDSSSPFASMVRDIASGRDTPTSAVNRLRELYESADSATRENMRMYLPLASGSAGGVGIDWGEASQMLRGYLTEENKINQDYNEAINEYNSLVASTPRYGFDETSGEEDELREVGRKAVSQRRTRAAVRGEGRSAAREQRRYGTSRIEEDYGISGDKFGDVLAEVASKTAKAYGRELRPRGRQFTPDTAARLEAALLASGLVQNVGGAAMGLPQLFSGMGQGQQMSDQQRKKSEKDKRFQDEIRRRFGRR